MVSQNSESMGLFLFGDPMPPFDAAMARRHKKDLSPKQVRQWVAVAQSMYDRCMADGGSTGPCEATAIRGANGVTGEPRGNLRHLTVHVALTAPPQHMTVNNIDYLTAPCVMLVAGVLNGGLIGEAELVPQDWNGVPVTIGHPTDATTGNAISARAPQVLANSGVGHVYHVRLGQGTRGTESVASLVGELWLDVARMQSMGGEAQQALTKLEAEEPLEVSTGFFSYAVAGQGSYLGTPYSEQHFDLRPDHLALLPNQVGACSWTDGCGSPRLHSACDCGGTCPTCQETMPMDDPSPTRLQALWTMLARFFHEDPLITHVLSSARRPSYSGTESTAWSAPSLGEAIKALGGTSEQQTANVADLPASLKRQVAALSLLGDPAADNARDLLFFPVVNPRTGKLNEGALRAVISGRGSQANIPEAAKTSAQNMARRLLNSAFDAGLETQQAPPEDEPDTPTETTPARCPECHSFLPEAEPGEEVECPNCGAKTTMPSAAAQQQTTTMADVRHAGDDPADTETDTRTTLAIHEEASMPTAIIKHRVDALITNERTRWTEQDRHLLESQDEAFLIRLEQQPLAPVKTGPPTTIQEAIATLPGNLQESMQAMADEYDQRKTAAIQVLVATKRCPFAEDELMAMTAQRVEDLVVMAGAAVPLRPGVQAVKDYSGRGGPARREVPDEEQVPLPPKTFALVVEHQRKLGLIQ